LIVEREEYCQHIGEKFYNHLLSEGHIAAAHENKRQAEAAQRAAQNPPKDHEKQIDGTAKALESLYGMTRNRNNPTGGSPEQPDSPPQEPREPQTPTQEEIAAQQQYAALAGAQR